MRRRTRRLNGLPEGGFTLLEVMVATVIMAIAVAGLLANLQSSLLLTSRATAHKRATLFAQQKMDELIADSALPNYRALNGPFVPAGTWSATAVPFDCPPHAEAGSKVLQKIELHVHWTDNERSHDYSLDGFRQSTLSEADALRIKQ